jgi:hypothetical protein
VYPSPFIAKIFYAVLLSPLQSRKSTFVHLQSALFEDKPSFERTMSLVNLIDRAIPGSTKRLSGWMYRNNRFPWSPIDIELIAFGAGAAVFKLNWKSGDKVLRIYRKSLGKSSRGLLEIAEYYKRNYETLLSWYGSSLNLVPPMEFLVLQGLPLIGPAAASLQPYIHGQKQDLFEDFSDDELLRLLNANDHVREQFLFFAKQTIHQWEGREICYDLVGRENLMLVKEGGNYKLHIVDVGFFRFDNSANHSAERMAQIERRMSRLTFLYDSAKNLG